MKKPTKFEQVLNYQYTNPNLRLAVARHVSLLSNEEAEARYGHSQAALAYRGDKTVAWLLDRHLSSSYQPQKFRNALLGKLGENQLMQRWIEARGLVKHLQYGNYKLVKKETYPHMLGTFFEAIVESLILDGSLAKAESIVQDYLAFSLQSLPATQFPAEQTNPGPLSATPALAWPNILSLKKSVSGQLFDAAQYLDCSIECRQLSQLQELFGDYFGAKPKVLLSFSKAKRKHSFNVYHQYVTGSFQEPVTVNCAGKAASVEEALQLLVQALQDRWSQLNTKTIPIAS